MKKYLLTLTAVVICSFCSAVAAHATTTLYGEAGLIYSKQEVSVDGNKVFSGNSFAQRYNVSWLTSNLKYLAQPQYYELSFGYSLLDFSTKISDGGQDSSLKQSYGKLLYSGRVGYNPLELPISLTAYINSGKPGDFKKSITANNLIQDDLIIDITGRNKTISSGFSFLFDPQRARTSSIFGLPRAYVDYRDTYVKTFDRFSPVDNRTRDLAVAGLNKENNWLIYRNLSYENYLAPSDNFNQQSIQLGLVDNQGRRKWAALTNWIDVSADGRFSQLQSPILANTREEYDLNFMAIATRKYWDVRTFLNYNRTANIAHIDEETRVPIYIKGVYGVDTNWYVGLSGANGRTITTASKLVEATRSNSISLGATTFNRYSFTLSPSLSASTSKSAAGIDSYDLQTKLETVSTRRFSDKLGLGATVFWRATDDGNGTANSKSWSNNAKLNATYNPGNRIVYRLSEDFESGSGSGYIEPSKLQASTYVMNKLSNYVRTTTSASASWTPSASMETSLDLRYDLLTVGNTQVNSQINVDHRFSYATQETTIRFNTNYTSEKNASGNAIRIFANSGNVQYRPDRSHDATIWYTYNDNNLSKSLDLRQKYTRNFMSRTGVIRNLGIISQEYGVNFSETLGTKISSQYLSLEGRYSPTERYSLYGSAKYAKSSPGSATMYYTAGISADFKLLSTSLDYSFAKRDSDNRVEKKLNASVRRAF